MSTASCTVPTSTYEALPATRSHRSAHGLTAPIWTADLDRSEEHTSELQSLMRISYGAFCLKKKKNRSYDILHICILPFLYSNKPSESQKNTFKCIYSYPTSIVARIHECISTS